jgi:hypothetical protein
MLLLACIVLGGAVGFLMWGGGDGYEATASVEFTTGSGDIGLVQMEAQTLAEKIMTKSVIERAARSLDEPAAGLAVATTAKRQSASFLIDVTSTGKSPEAAVARANAVAQAAVADLRADVLARVGAATDQANALLQDPQLMDPDAEAARRTQVGSAIGGRQEGLKGQSEAWSVVGPAVQATPAGIPKALSTAMGQAVGLFVGCLIALLLGTRGLRTRSAASVSRLAPGVEVLTTSQTPQIVGRMIQAGDTYLAVVATAGSHDAADEFAAGVERILSAHGKTVTVVHAPATVDPLTNPLLRAGAPTRVRDLVGTDVLVVVVNAGTESAAMLQGRSEIRAVVLVRRNQTSISDALSAQRAYKESAPTLVVAR